VSEQWHSNALRGPGSTVSWGPSFARAKVTIMNGW